MNSRDITPYTEGLYLSDLPLSPSFEGEFDATRDSLEFEPSENARKTVCPICWRYLFNTIELEQFGWGKSFEVNYVVYGGSIVHAAEMGCPWCFFLTRCFGLKEDLSPDFCTISLSQRGEKHTPRGANGATVYLESDKRGLLCSGIGFRARGDNVAGMCITARERQPDVSPLATCKQITQWLDNCAGHQSCDSESESRLPTRLPARPMYVGLLKIVATCKQIMQCLNNCAGHQSCDSESKSRLPTRLPTRLIDVGLLKIVETTGGTGRYAALSYCWGTSRQPTLSKSNLESYSQDLNYDHLPQTIKDAIEVTKSIDVHYLWVDALCIIQDDETDKVHELGNMGRTYTNAYITIAASNASSVHEGFLGPRPASFENDLSIPFPVSIKDGIFGRATVVTKRDSEEPGSDPIHSRAWTLQEHVLAKRLLSYSSHTLQWRCRAGTLNLGNSLHSEYHNGVPLLDRSDKNTSSMLSRYLAIVVRFSERSLSFPSDKLPALAALAEELAPVLGPEYHAGIWKYDMVKQLAWYVSDDHSSIWHETTYDRTEYRAPSWSWASVGAPIEYRTFGTVTGTTHLLKDFPNRLEDVCTILAVETKTKFEEAPYGEVVSGSLTVRAKLLLVWMSSQRPPDDEYSKPCLFRVPLVWAVGETPSQLLSRRKTEHTIPTESPSDSTRLEADYYMDGLGLEPQHVGFVFFLPLYLDSDSYAYDGIIIDANGRGDFQRIGFFERGYQSGFDGAEEREIIIV